MAVPSSAVELFDNVAQSRDLRFFPGELEPAHHVDEELMNAPVPREFRVERGRQQFALPHQDREPVPFRQDLNPRANTGNTRRADINHLQRSTSQPGFPGLDGAIDLPPIGIPFHADIHHSQTLLSGLGDIAGKEDTPGTSTKRRLLLNETLQRFKQPVALKKLEEGRRLPTRKNQSVQTFQLRRSAHLNGICPSLDKSLGMGSKISLDGKHPNARTLQALTSRGFAAVHPLAAQRSRDLASPRSSVR
jgi:hypothetical protein